MRDVLKAASQIEASGQFVCERFFLEETVGASRTYGPFEQALGIKFAALQYCELCAEQRGAACKILRAMFVPGPELTLMNPQRLSVAPTLGSRGVPVQPYQCQCHIEMIVGSLEDSRCQPQEALYFVCGGDGSRVVVSEEACLQFTDPVCAGDNPITRRTLQLLFELLLVEAIMVEAAESGRQPRRVLTNRSCMAMRLSTRAKPERRAK